MPTGQHSVPQDEEFMFVVPQDEEFMFVTAYPASSSSGVATSAMTAWDELSTLSKKMELRCVPSAAASLINVERLKNRANRTVHTQINCVQSGKTTRNQPAVASAPLVMAL